MAGLGLRGTKCSQMRALWTKGTKTYINIASRSFKTGSELIILCRRGKTKREEDSTTEIYEIYISVKGVLKDLNFDDEFHLHMI